VIRILTNLELLVQRALVDNCHV